MIERKGGNLDVFRPICGLPINTYFSAVKMKYLYENSSAVAAARKGNKLNFGTIDSWLIWVSFSFEFYLNY